MFLRDTKAQILKEECIMVSHQSDRSQSLSFLQVDKYSKYLRFYPLRPTAELQIAVSRLQW